MAFKAYVIFDHLKWDVFSGARTTGLGAVVGGGGVSAVVRGIFRVGSGFGVGFSAGVGGVFVWVGEGAGRSALGAGLSFYVVWTLS